MGTPHLVYLDPRAIAQHSEAAKLPPLSDEQVKELADSMSRKGFDPAYPLKLSLDAKCVLDGDGRRRAAILAGVKEVPCVLMREGEDEQEFILAASLLRKHLTDDQRAVIALRYQRRLTEIRNVEKGRKGARKRKGDGDPSETDKLTGPENSRKEAAAAFGVPENKLKTLANIEKYEREQGTKPEASLILRVLAGEVDLGKASEPARIAKEQEHKRKVEAERAAAQQDRERREAERKARVAALPDTPAVQGGDPLAVMRREFKGDQNQPKIDILVLLTDDPSEVRRVLDAAKSAVAESWACVVVTSFPHDAKIAQELQQTNLGVVQLIWDFGTNDDKRPSGKSHRSVLWGAKGRTLSSQRGGDVIRSASPDGRPREDFWDRLFTLAANENDTVFLPQTSDAKASIQAVRSKLRPFSVVPEDGFAAAREEYERSTNPNQWFTQVQKTMENGEVSIVLTPGPEVQHATAI